MRAAALLPFALVAGCSAATTAPGPRDALGDYVDAAAAGDCAAAYGLMSSAYRAETSREDFCQAMRDNPAEFREAVQSLRRVEGDPEITARVRYGLGDEMSFVLEGGRWRIDSPVFDFYAQETPRDALRSFVRAVESRRYDVILRFVPSEYRERMSAEALRTLWEGDKRDEIQQLLENLRASLDEPIEETGDRATMQYMDRFTCRFLREDGLWRIEDPD
jgi:hypothetical protein